MGVAMEMRFTSDSGEKRSSRGRRMISFRRYVGRGMRALEIASWKKR